MLSHRCAAAIMLSYRYTAAIIRIYLSLILLNFIHLYLFIQMNSLSIFVSQNCKLKMSNVDRFSIRTEIRMKAGVLMKIRQNFRLIVRYKHFSKGSVSKRC